MTQPVIDVASNLEENIQRWASALRRSGLKRKAYEDVIYASKKKTWTSAELAAALSIDKQAAAAICGQLVGDTLLRRIPDAYPHQYTKIRDAQYYKDRILVAARSKSKRDAIPTKRNVRVTVASQRGSRYGRAANISIDRVDQFGRVEKIKKPVLREPLPESAFKDGLKRLFAEDRRFGDWGGERNDFYTDKLRIRGRRFAAAFALKGPGVKSKTVTPAKWGKQGDQIQRLVNSPAQVLFLQFEGEIDQSSREQLKKLAQLKAHQEDDTIYYGFIDDQDSARLRSAYPAAFRRTRASEK